MEKNASRPQSISAAQVDGAVDEALERVEEVKELTEDDLGQASGGIQAPISTGFLPVEEA